MVSKGLICDQGNFKLNKWSFLEQKNQLKQKAVQPQKGLDIQDIRSNGIVLDKRTMMVLYCSSEY